MAKWANDLFMDAAFDWLSSNATTMLACTAQPIDRANALALALADVAVAAGDFTKSDGVSGRKVTVAAKNDVTIDANGTATHVVIISGTILLYVTTCTSVVLAAAGLVDFPAWNIQISDPT